jgi:hypothetical protein
MLFDRCGNCGTNGLIIELKVLFTRVSRGAKRQRALSQVYDTETKVIHFLLLASNEEPHHGQNLISINEEPPS